VRRAGNKRARLHIPSHSLLLRLGWPCADWDFGNFVPDAVIINLGERGVARGHVVSPLNPRPSPPCAGTNDFGHDSGPAWEANFTATYVQVRAAAVPLSTSTHLPPHTLLCSSC